MSNASYSTSPAWLSRRTVPASRFARNAELARAKLERFVGYSLNQGLMAKKMAVEKLFLPLIDVAPRHNATYAIIFHVLGYQAASGDLIWVANDLLSRAYSAVV